MVFAKGFVPPMFDVLTRYEKSRANTLYLTPEPKVKYTLIWIK